MTLAYSQPNQSEASFEPQARGYGEELEIIAASASLYPIKCVLDGVVTSASTGLTVATSLGVVWYDGEPIVVAADTATAATADGTYARVDYVYYDVGLDDIAIASGTAADDPQPPDLDDDWILLAELTIPASLATITASHIVDKRTITGEPPSTGTWYVNPSGTAKGSSTWTGWGKRPEVAFTTVTEAVTAATSGETIAMLGEETIVTANMVSTSKTLRFVGLTPDAGWLLASYNSATPWFELTGDNCEFHDLSFTKSYTSTATGHCIDASGADDGRIYNCRFNGNASSTIYENMHLRDGWKIQGCYFWRIGYNIDLDGVGNVITSNEFEECQYPIFNNASSNFDGRRTIVSNNTFYNNTNRDVDVRYSIVSNNTFTMTSAGSFTGKTGIVRARSTSLVSDNLFNAALTSTSGMSSVEMIEIDDESIATGNHMIMGAYWNGSAIATYTGTAGGNYISNNHIRRNGGTSAVDTFPIIDLRGPEDVAANNFFYIRPCAQDDLVVINCDGYRQVVHGNFFHDDTDGSFSSLAFVSPHTAGTTVMRGNMVSKPSYSDYPQPIPDETVTFVAADYGVQANDNGKVIQAGGAAGINVTLPEVGADGTTNWGLSTPSDPFIIQRKDASNNITIDVEDVAADVIWKDGTNTYTSISLASDGAAVALYWDDTDWMVLWDRGTVSYS